MHDGASGFLVVRLGGGRRGGFVVRFGGGGLVVRFGGRGLGLGLELPPPDDDGGGLFPWLLLRGGGGLPLQKCYKYRYL